MDNEEAKDLEFYKTFYDENRVALLQYKSLRSNFNIMVHNVLGDKYYNMAADVYDADRLCCEDITRKANSKKSIFEMVSDLITNKGKQMTYKEYIKSELERASKNEWFDINGNNSVATSNRGFIAEMKLQIKGFNYDVINSFSLKELALHIMAFMMFLSLPVTYIPFLTIRTILTRKRARKDMMEGYNKHVKQTT